MIRKNKVPVVNALLAAVVYAASIPVSKLVLAWLPPVSLADLLYFGAGVSMLLFSLLVSRNRQSEAV